jgi:release factor glutamine methyltransferase
MASDISQQALDVAQQNVTDLDLKNISLIHSHWFSSLSVNNFNIIVSNPPYLAHDDPHLAIGDLRYEPKLALVSGSNGLESLQSIIEESYNRILQNGFLVLEHGFQQRLAVEKCLSINGYRDIQCWQDDQGHDRVSCAKK